MTLRRALLLSCLILSGCDCAGHPSHGEGAPCQSDGQCGDGLMCLDGLCRVRADAGAQPDASTTSDAGCPAASRCGDACCASGEECVASSCQPMCASGLRCGPDMTCCGADQLCIGDACVAPGDACTEEIDCPIDAYCDATVGHCLPRAGAARCEYHPPAATFAPDEQWAWTGSDTVPESVHVMMAPVVGDLDGDGTPEVAFNTYASGTSYGGPGVLRIVHGDTGVEMTSIASPVVCPEHGIALGDLDGDGTPEIVTALSPCDDAQIAAFEPDGTLLWQSANADGSAFSGPFGFGAPAIADLEGDGMAEVIIGGVVLEHDGTVRWTTRTGAASNCCSATPRSPLTAVYDVDADGALEVVSGNAVWEADGTVLWENPSLSDGFVAVADFFGDDTPDIVVVHQDPAGSGDGYVSIRSGTDGSVLWGPVAQPGGGRGGPPTVADFDGDGLPEIRRRRRLGLRGLRPGR